VQNWLLKVLDFSAVQAKSLLLIDGTVKSGKTLLAELVLPFLVDHLRRNPTSGMMRGLDFTFNFLDLSPLGGMTTVNDKLAALEKQMKRVFGDLWKPRELLTNPFSRVQDGLQMMMHVSNAPQVWFFVLDEYHFLFQGLSSNDIDNVSQCMKMILLDSKSPFHFVLAGSTQAAFWWSIHRARPSGLNMMLNPTVITTSYQASADEMALCRRVMVERKVVEEATFDQVVATLQDQCTVANVVQVVKRTRQDHVDAARAYELFLATKAQVYWRDYWAVPDGVNPDLFVRRWATDGGGDWQPPPLMQHLFYQHPITKAYLLLDRFFDAFLKAHYDSKEKKLLRYNRPIPWAVLLLFAPLLPVSQQQKDKKLDETKFEGQAQALCLSSFDTTKRVAVASYLTQHPANPSYVSKLPTDVTWVLFMRLLRNILAHEYDVDWTGLQGCLDLVLELTHTRENFRQLIDIYVSNVIP
jgi:hypothetical protein